MPSDAHTSVSLDKYTIILFLFLKFLCLCWLPNTQKYIIKPYISILKTTRTKPLYWSNLLPYNCTYCTNVNLSQVNFWTVFANIILLKLKTHLSRNILHLDHINVMCFSLKAKLKLIPIILRNILIFLSFPYIFVGNFL